MSDTPETDAKACDIIGFFSCATVPAEFARNLERERDEARAKYATEATEHMLAVNKLCNERDEARDRYNELLGVKKVPKWYNGREIPITAQEAAK